MSITLDIHPDGASSITVDGTTRPLPAGDLRSARQQGMATAQQHAQEQGQTVTVTANEPSGTYRFHVQPNGVVSPAPEPSPPAPSPSYGQPANNDMPAPSAPEASAAWAPRPTPEQGPAPAPTHPAQLDEAARVAPMPGLEDLLDARGSQGTAAVDPVEGDARWADISKQPAQRGWRGTLAGLGVKVSPSAEELRQRRETLREQIESEEQQRLEEEAREREEAAQETRRATRAREEAERNRGERTVIQTNFGGCQTVTVANSKGGAHKTTVTALLAATFGRIRGGGVVAWDANETMGTLGDRTMEDLHSNTVVDLLEKSAADFSSVETSLIGTIDKYTRPQGDNHFSVLASDEDPERQDMVDGAGFRTVHQILERFNRMIFVDTGNNARADHFLAAVDATDQLVIPVSAGLDSALVAEKMMKALVARGHDDLVQNAVVMLHDSESRKVDDTDTARRFEGRVSTVIPVPFDPALKDGGKIDYDALQPATKRAYQEAAAAIASNLRSRLTAGEGAH